MILIRLFVLLHTQEKKHFALYVQNLILESIIKTIYFYTGPLDLSKFESQNYGNHC